MEGGGAENVWLDAGVHRTTAIQNSILNGGYYNWSLEGQQLLAESIQHLLFKEFINEKGIALYTPELTILAKIKESIAKWNVNESRKHIGMHQTSSCSKVANDL